MEPRKKDKHTHTHPSEGVGITAGGEEVRNVILEEPQHGLLLLPDRLDPRLYALHGAPAAHRRPAHITRTNKPTSIIQQQQHPNGTERREKRRDF